MDNYNKGDEKKSKLSAWVWIVLIAVLAAVITYNLKPAPDGQKKETLTEKLQKKAQDIAKQRKSKSEKKSKPQKESIKATTFKLSDDGTNCTDSVIALSSEFIAINPYKFKGNKNIKEVYMGRNLEHVAENAFERCTNLKKLHFQSVVKVINDNAFWGCTSLEHLDVDVWTVGLNGFYGCSSLQDVRLGDHLWWLRDGAFANCKNLKRVLMGVTLAKLEDGAFTGSPNIEEFSVPNDYKRHMFFVMRNCKKVKTVYMLTLEYFDFPANNPIPNFPSADCTLYVPDVFLDQFKADAQWSRFGKILPLSQSKYYTAEGFSK